MLNNKRKCVIHEIMLFTARSQLVLQRQHILLNFFLLSIEGEKMRSIGGEGCGYQFKITLTKSGPQISIGINSSIYNDQNQLCVSYGSI